DCEPPGTGVGQALAGRLAGALVADEAVERVACVSHMGASALLCGEPEQRLTYTVSCARRASAGERRPVLHAGRVTRAHSVAVLLEEVQRASACIDEDRAERRLSESDDRALG